MSDVFYTRDNIKVLFDKIKPTFEYIDETSLKKILYDIMTKINDIYKSSNMSLQQLNIHVIDDIKKHLEKQTPQLPQKLEKKESKALFNDHAIIPKAPQQRIVEKYINISSQDRSWYNNDDPYRYSYKVDLINRHRNIRSIKVGKLIIPDEIIQLSGDYKENFNDSFQFDYQYLILKIDQFTDVYDGSNTLMNDCFCKLIYHKSYRTQQGRGFVILKPEQDEQKIFYPVALSELSRLSIQILNPNGQLLNTTVDNYNISSVTFDTSNPACLTITLASYFDMNIFYLGDYVLIKQFDTGNTEINEFVNSTHVVVSMGTSNSNGFFNSFLIKNKGIFNSTLGSFSVDNNFVSLINAYNANNTNQTMSGKVLNTSLQNSLSMKLDVIVDDVKSLNTNTFFNF